MSQTVTSLPEHFARVADPRVGRTKRHLLIDILVMAICAVICGADDWVAVAAFGCAKQAWFKTFLIERDSFPRHVWTGVCAAGPAAISASVSGLDSSRQ